MGLEKTLIDEATTYSHYLIGHKYLTIEGDFVPAIRIESCQHYHEML